MKGLKYYFIIFIQIFMVNIAIAQDDEGGDSSRLPNLDRLPGFDGIHINSPALLLGRGVSFFVHSDFPIVGNFINNELTIAGKVKGTGAFSSIFRIDEIDLIVSAILTDDGELEEGGIALISLKDGSEFAAGAVTEFSAEFSAESFELLPIDLPLPTPPGTGEPEASNLIIKLCAEVEGEYTGDLDITFFAAVAEPEDNRLFVENWASGIGIITMHALSLPCNS